MRTGERSICLFSSYFTKEKIPYYVKFYLEELTNYFTEVILLTNIKDLHIDELAYLKAKNIQVRLYENEGMDFGMWYKALNEFTHDYDKIALVNDSCIMYSNLKDFFNWEGSSDADYTGMLITGKISLHVQSYFLVIKRKAIPLVRNFFKDNGTKNNYSEIISTYEIGLSTYLLKHNIEISGFYDYSKVLDVNPSFILADELIAKNNPLLKKKIIAHNYYLGDYLTWYRNNFNIDYTYYIKLIQQQHPASEIIDFDKVVKEINGTGGDSYIIKYKTGYFFYKMFKKIGPLKFIFHNLIVLKRYIKR